MRAAKRLQRPVRRHSPRVGERGEVVEGIGHVGSDGCRAMLGGDARQALLGHLEELGGGTGI